MHKKNPWFTLPVLLVILFFGLYLRYDSVMNTTVIQPIRADARDYFMYAYNLRHKHIYSREVGKPQNLGSPVLPDAVRTPGYPLFLIFFVDGLPHKEMIDRILISQAIISTMTLLLAFFVFRGLLPPFWAIMASLLVSLSPHLIVANSYVLTETLFCFLLVLSGYFIMLFSRKPSLWLGLIIGIVIGTTSLVRPSLQYFPIIIAAFLMFHYGWRKGLRFSTVVIFGFALIIAPWVLRNKITLNKSSDNKQMIMFLLHGMYPNFTYDHVKESFGFPYRYDPRTKEITQNVSSILKEIGRRFDQETGKHIKWFILGKPRALWSWNMVQGAGDAFVYPVSKSPYFYKGMFRWTHRLMYRIHWPLVLLCMFGCVMAWFPLLKVGLNKEAIFTARLISLLLLYYTIIHMIGVPLPRYSVPLRPFLYGMALFTPCILITAFRQYRLYQKNAGDIA